jgi:hypothetical protein
LGVYWLGLCLQHGCGCAQDKSSAHELFREAAELGLPAAQLSYAESFGELDWRRYLWVSRATSRGSHSRVVCNSFRTLAEPLERGEMGRALHVLAPVVRKNLVVAERRLFREPLSETDISRLQRVLQLHAAMLECARSAVRCWSLVGLRCGLVKDVRVVIAKIVWEEPWRWSAKG